MSDLTELDGLFEPVDESWPPTPVIEREPRKCRRHRWNPEVIRDGAFIRACERCGKPYDETLVRRGRQSRNYGNRAELAVARKYGGTKVGHAGGPVDVRGAEFNVQVKTHRRLPPAEWRKAFGGMSASLERIPRLLLRFLPGPGLPPDDYFVIRADDWLRWYGKDEVKR